MTDGIQVTPGAGPKIATDEVTRNSAVEHQQIIKISLGAEGSFDNLVDSGQQLSEQSVPVVLSSDHPPIQTKSIADLPYKILIDVQGLITYAGKSLPGTLGSQAAWQVSKIDETSNPTQVTWANAGAFDQIWDNRVSLAYT